jgi:hypothetical protein
MAREGYLYAAKLSEQAERCEHWKQAFYRERLLSPPCLLCPVLSAAAMASSMPLDHCLGDPVDCAWVNF